MQEVDNIALAWLEQNEKVKQEQAKLDQIIQQISDIPEFSPKNSNDYNRRLQIQGDTYRIFLTRPTKTVWDHSALKDLDYPEVIEYEPKVNARKLKELEQEDQDRVNACSVVSIFKENQEVYKPRINIEPLELEEDIGADI